MTTKKLFGIKVAKKSEKTKRITGVHQRVHNARFAGYPGLKNTTEQISHLIPKCKIFVEPFAGLGRISKKVKAEKYVLNDLSDFAQAYLKKNFRYAEITQDDWLITIEKYDSPDTFFFIDPPWDDNIYQKNPLTVCTKKPKAIYDDLEKLLPTIKGNWIVAGKKDGPLKKWPSHYHHMLIVSLPKKIFNKSAKTYLVSNQPLKHHIQKKLFES